MPEIIPMPLLSDTMTEGVVAIWHKKVGDTVKSGQLLAEIETDKATLDFEAPSDGVLLYHAEAGQPIKVKSLLAIIAEPDETIDVAAIVASFANGQPTATPPTPATTTQTTENPAAVAATPATVSPPANETTTTSNERLKVSPLAKRLAEASEVPLHQIAGTGPEGRIVKRDVEAFVQTQQQQTTTTTPETETTAAPAATNDANARDERVSQMRKTIARRLAESKFTAPHFYLKTTVTMDAAMAARKTLNEMSPVKISFNDLIVKAAAMALRHHPAINASWLGDVIRYHSNINIGVAVAVEDGLLVPVIANTDQKSLSQISTQTVALAEKAKTKKLQPDEMQGNTFTISNLGMFDIDEFTAIINPPDVCILAVGKIAQVPAVVNNEIKIANHMKLILSCDHRVVDGATGAKFLQSLREMLENPMRMLV
ncbi:MAG: pyruvate dehydrogenase complex dihydrolipoamide acetyltransferase [Sphingobacteriales bacterium]|jgi:pyruvate dehydrogenase E2 component (dihydrolipoamide acetyltransferase)|nr:pyruvate dehydrogenase complex dihydrolipoamide acetyltransferase [Sphingobacteriales bacterium]MBP9141464.1 pyruvate dehydrogenase complex dihydrolipoamide acetyltransferase [Chitinophagales bacterium]MDA0198442.1 pyruvate dehydrogenase complex dihydrolipoamide acetyltransferase [Bacteroidota bacterium]MBK6890903.1 pyruvate dehydrogenase complex dihydrolipoamide acetyltransferase [Sphingobacteriales bacterium]MBK7526045.1 pyruvate dehydrogenase complex dihydrolipoamide acetyltransferase [Sp